MTLLKYKKFIVFITFLMFSIVVNGQQFKRNTEIGVLLGTSYYLGELNTTHFNKSSAAAGLIIRRNINKRFCYKAEAVFLNVRADERNSENAISNNRGLHFRSIIYDLSGQLEFNFLPYQPENPLYQWTPFIFTGISLFNFNPQAENKNGEWVNLQELGTEGQGSTSYPDRKLYSLTQISIPLGGGIKIAINDGFNIIFEYSFRKTFSDYLDDVSTTYPAAGLTDISADSYEMSDPNYNSSDPTSIFPSNAERGDPGKKDWYTFAGITLSFNLSNDTKGCDY